MSQWTANEPATLAEIEAELQKHRGETLYITSWGGSWQGAIRQAAWVPFTEQFGIEIVEDSPVDFGKIRSMAETGNVTWDIVDFGTRSVYALGEAGNLEVVTPAIHNGYLDGLPDVTQTPWSAGGGVLWSMGIAYRLSAVDEMWGGKTPTSWADFWDVEAFPGRRSLGSRPHENLIFAQMALHPEVMETIDGRLSIAALDDAQVAESYQALSDIKPNIAYWWKGFTDCPQMLISGELDMCSSSNGRIYDAQQPGAGGEDLYYCYECGHINQTGVYSIIKGSPRKELAELYLAWWGYPENAVRVSTYIPFGQLHKDAIVMLSETITDPDYLAALPTSPVAVQNMVIMDEKWLGQNLDKGQLLLEKFEALLLE
jgi:putative spermidine/putrescine transport system substrate-binding protein